MSILRRSRFGDGCDQFSYNYEKLDPGFGFCITTYAGDGTQLPPFRGEPLLTPIRGEINDVAESYWEMLDEANRVALAVKYIDIGTGQSTIHIINKYKKIS